MSYLFVYGTLMFPEIGKRFFGKQKGQSAFLYNYHCFSILEDGLPKLYPAIVPQIKSVVEGLLFKVDEEQLEDLDWYEGAKYDRIKTSLQCNDQTIIAWVYVWNNSSGAKLQGTWQAEDVDLTSLQRFIEDEFDT